MVDESYDIPRSHQLPYYNMAHLMDRVQGNDALNPIAASTPNLVTSLNNTQSTSPTTICNHNMVSGNTATYSKDSINFLSNIRTLPRAHCYTNAAPTKIEGNVFRYDFVEQSDLPPVNRNLKPKFTTETDKVTDESNSKSNQTNTSAQMESLYTKLQNTQIQNSSQSVHHNINEADSNAPRKPPSVDRKNKPTAYKV